VVAQGSQFSLKDVEVLDALVDLDAVSFRSFRLLPVPFLLAVQNNYSCLELEKVIWFVCQSKS
jgi:hypothetical protein